MFYYEFDVMLKEKILQKLLYKYFTIYYIQRERAVCKISTNFNSSFILYGLVISSCCVYTVWVLWNCKLSDISYLFFSFEYMFVSFHIRYVELNAVITFYFIIAFNQFYWCYKVHGMFRYWIIVLMKS